MRIYIKKQIDKNPPQKTDALNFKRKSTRLKKIVDPLIITKIEETVKRKM